MQKEFYITFSILDVVRIFLTKGSKLIENAKEEFLTEKKYKRSLSRTYRKSLTSRYVASELQLPGFRIDTLAFNKESSAFYIIVVQKDSKLLSYRSGIALP